MHASSIVINPDFFDRFFRQMIIHMLAIRRIQYANCGILLKAEYTFKFMEPFDYFNFISM